jgi:hypothetical protein
MKTYNNAKQFDGYDHFCPKYFGYFYLQDCSQNTLKFLATQQLETGKAPRDDSSFPNPCQIVVHLSYYRALYRLNTEEVSLNNS